MRWHDASHRSSDSDIFDDPKSVDMWFMRRSYDLLIGHISLGGLYNWQKYSSVISIVCKQRWIDIGCMPAIGRKQLGPFIRSPTKQKD